MYKKLAKKLLLGLLTVALLLTTVAVMPANTQAASKKAKKATISAEYKTPNYRSVLLTVRKAVSKYIHGNCILMIF